MLDAQCSDPCYCRTQSRFIPVLDMGFLGSHPPSSAYPEGCSGWNTCSHYTGDWGALFPAVNLAKCIHTTDMRSGQLASHSPKRKLLSDQSENSFPPTPGQLSVRYSLPSPHSRLTLHHVTLACCLRPPQGHEFWDISLTGKRIT